MEFSSKILQTAVDALSSLPTVGKKSALRLALHLYNQDEPKILAFLNAIKDLKSKLKVCNECYNLSDLEKCSICTDSKRKGNLLCVVENVRDVMAIEETALFRGKYHVLGGVISPLDGVGVSDLKIIELINRVKLNNVDELIMGISPTIEGDTTIFYIAKQLKETGIKISMLSRGVAFGGEIEYTDELTLGRALQARIPYAQPIHSQI